MKSDLFPPQANCKFPHPGNLLIASPLLYDSHFAHAVVLMVAHETEGSMGIVINKEFPERLVLNSFIPELERVPPIPLFCGGPMETNTLFFIHNLDFIIDSLPLGNGLYFCGSFDALMDYISRGNPVEGRIRFFAGYAGWDKGQLAKEIREGSWLVGETDRLLVFDDCHESIWRKSIQANGIPYHLWMTYPVYPALS